MASSHLKMEAESTPETLHVKYIPDKEGMSPVQYWSTCMTAPYHLVFSRASCSHVDRIVAKLEDFIN